MVDGELREVALPGDEVEIVLTETPFYPESGGQSGDHGEIVTADGLRLEVVDVQRPVKGLVVHKVKVGEGELRTGQTVQAEVDGDWRLGACQAHSATHVIHEALHQILGPTALQAGSFNRPGYMRLDFRWNHGVTEDQQGQIEQLSNEAIRADLGVIGDADAAGRGEGVRRHRLCSARCTATSSGWSTWATAGRASCARAPTSRSRPRSGCWRSTRSPRSVPASAGSRRSSGWRRSSTWPRSARW